MDRSRWGVRELLLDFDDAWLINVVAHLPDGTKVGRISPNMGGPKSFEPALMLDNFVRIHPPKFPLNRDLRRCWRHSIKVWHE
jgi:hypothetical protein